MLYYTLPGLASPAVVAAPHHGALVDFLELYELRPLLDHFPSALARRPAGEVVLLTLTPLGLLAAGEYAKFDALTKPLLTPRPVPLPNPDLVTRRYYDHLPRAPRSEPEDDDYRRDPPGPGPRDAEPEPAPAQNLRRRDV